MITMRCGICVALALLAPALTVWFSAGPMRAALGLLPAPFAWPGVLAVHLLAGLPIGFVVAWALQRRWPAWTVKSPIGPVFAIVLLSFFVYGVAPILGVALDAWQADWLSRTFVRFVVCLLLQLPWLILALGDSSPLGRFVEQVPAALAILVGILLPTAHAWHVIDQQTRRTEEALQEQRIFESRSLARGLCDMGSTEAIAGTPPRLALRQMEDLLEALQYAIATPIAENASTEQRLDRARTLAMLGRLDEAAGLVDPLAHQDFDATLLLALIRQTQKHFPESEMLYQKVLDHRDLPPAQRTDRLKRAYDGLAFNARAQKQFTRAQAIYEDALNRLPDAKAHFHFQLGRHFHQAGRSQSAQSHLTLAASLDAAQYAPRVEPILQELRQHSPACLIRR